MTIDFFRTDIQDFRRALERAESRYERDLEIAYIETVDDAQRTAERKRRVVRANYNRAY